MPGYEVRVDEYTPARKRSNVDEEKKLILELICFNKVCLTIS